MIHSTSGGIIREKIFFDFAKVQFETGESYFYINKIPLLKEGDFVLVPFGNGEVKGKVLRIDRKVSQDVAPVSIKRAKEIICVLDY